MQESDTAKKAFLTKLLNLANLHDFALKDTEKKPT